MRDRAARYLFFGQLVFFVMLTVVYWLLPFSGKALLEHNGICYFQTFDLTNVLYLLAFFAVTSSIAVAGWELTMHGLHRRKLGWGLLAVSVMLLAIAMPPYYTNDTVHFIHNQIAAGLFVLEGLIAIWLLIQTRGDKILWALFAIEFVGSILAGLTYLHLYDIMFTGEAVAQLAFGLIIVRGVNLLDTIDRR